jgi:hypothetical protein
MSLRTLFENDPTLSDISLQLEEPTSGAVPRALPMPRYGTVRTAEVPPPRVELVWPPARPARYRRKRHRRTFPRGARRIRVARPMGPLEIVVVGGPSGFGWLEIFARLKRLIF